MSFWIKIYLSNTLFQLLEPMMMFVDYGAIYLAIWTLSGEAAHENEPRLAVP